LRPLNNLFPAADSPDLIIGLDAPDDSAVYRLDSDRAIIATTDFFPPVVDDPYDFGAIAAANALSDVYAMGGEPIFAINLAAFPDGLDMAILAEILRGGAEKVREAGAVIAGGHTIADQEPKYGLSVIGLVHPSAILTKSGARPGDILILTKPLGTGVITTALKNGKADSQHVNAAVASMSRLNREASRLAVRHGVHAMTDITGYGFLGHGHEMAHLSEVDLRVDYSALKWLSGAQIYGAQDMFPGGMIRNREYFDPWVQFDSALDEVQQNLLFDPQTSGGLLIAVDREIAPHLNEEITAQGDQAAIIGEVIPGSGHIMVNS
jgi:selenide,water dikinase